MTMQLVETKTLGSSAASIEFTNIPQDGTDLLIVLSARTNSAADLRDTRIQVNGNTGSNYGRRTLRGDGASTFSSTNSPASNIDLQLTAQGGSTTSNTFGSLQIYIPNYTTAATKSFSFDAVTENNATTASQNITAGSYSVSEAITSIKLYPSTDSWDTNSTASIYKIKKA